LGTPTSLDTDQEKHLPPLDSALRKNVEAKIIPARDAVERAAQAAIPRPSPWARGNPSITLLALGRYGREWGVLFRLQASTGAQGLVFATQSGTLLHPSNLRDRSFTPLLKKAALPTIRFHDLRHTCATLLLGRNVNPKVVSEMLGHATIAITLDTYSHVLPDMQDHATRALEDALSWRVAVRLQ
jgi:integrase